MEMGKLWGHFKRWGMPLLRHLKMSAPVLLVLACAIVLVGIWWLGPRWTWRDHQPLADLSTRVSLTVLFLFIPMLIWALVLRSR